MEQNPEEMILHENRLDVTLIPFNYRKSPLLSISFRSFDIEMGQFKLKIESDGESNLKTPIISNLCEITMVPKFQIDYNNKEINYLNTTTYPKYIISLLDINNNEKMKFNVNLLELSFLGKDLYTVSIYHYPMLILEFMDGNYTTTELFQANDSLINENSSKKTNTTNTDSNINIEENLNIGNLLESVPDIDSINSINDLEFSRTDYDRNASMAFINPDIVQRITSNLVNKETALQNEDKKKKQVRSSCFIDNNDLKKLQNKDALKKMEIEKDNKKDKNKKNKSKKKSKKYNKEIKEKKIDTYSFSDYFDLYLEKILFFRDELNENKENNENNEKEIKNTKNIVEKKENIENIINLYKRKQRINQIKKEKEFYKKKEQDINDIKQKMQIIIAQKKDLLAKLNEGIISHKIKYNKLKANNDKIIPIIAEQQLIYDSFLNKKIAEICFVFFNKKIKSLYFIPDFLLNTIKSDNNENIKKRIEFYNNNKKKISSMMGYITQLMIYMSKCFDIPLRYPLMLNGAKSFIIKGKNREKDFLPLHCDMKRDDKFLNFESGLIYLKNDFKEIINFCSMYPEIISENEFYKFNRDNVDYTFFKLFINFNHCLSDFIKNIQKMFE